MEPIEEVDKAIRENVRGVEKSFSDIGKPTKKAERAGEKAKEPESEETEKPEEAESTVKKEEEEQQ